MYKYEIVIREGGTEKVVYEASFEKELPMNTEMLAFAILIDRYKEMTDVNKDRSFDDSIQSLLPTTNTPKNGFFRKLVTLFRG